MLISAGISSISESTNLNTQNNPSIKLTLYERICKIFSRLYEKISNLFSRTSNQMKALKRIESIYDVPLNNRPVNSLTFYEKISNFFSKGSSRTELIEERINQVNAQLQQNYQALNHYICINRKRINYLEICLKDVVVASKTKINSLEQRILFLEEELYSNKIQVSQSDSGLLESSPPEKKQGFLSKAKSFTKQHKKTY